MIAPRFLDVNGLLNSISRDPAEVGKRGIAEGLLDADDMALSVQEITLPVTAGALEIKAGAPPALLGRRDRGRCPLARLPRATVRAHGPWPRGRRRAER